MASLLSGIARRLGSAAVSPLMCLHITFPTAGILVELLTDPRECSKRQEEEAASVARPEPGNGTSSHVATIFYWASSQRAPPDSKGGTIHLTAHSIGKEGDKNKQNRPLN